MQSEAHEWRELPSYLGNRFRMDKLTSEHRSWNMSRIRSKDTKPECAVRSILHRMGYRFSLHRRDLPGTPDIVLPKYHTVVEVRSCFFHRHCGCKKSTTPSTNTAFWLDKFEKNVKRDRRNVKALRALGWHVIIVWQCETDDLETLAGRLAGEMERLT